MANNLKRFSPSARRVLSLAQEEAEYLQNGIIDTDHILTGMMREEQGAAGKILRALGANALLIQALVEHTRRSDTPRMATTSPELSDDVKHMLEAAAAEATRRSQTTIDTTHLLWGLLDQRRSAAVSLLQQLNVQPGEVRARLETAFEQGDDNSGDG